MARSKVIGAKRAVKGLRQFTSRGRKAMANAMYLEGLHVLADSVPRVPVMTSRLRNSQFATIPSGKVLRMKAGYGTKYAWRVHEGIKTRIKDQPRHVQRAFWGGKWKKTSTTSSRSGGTITTSQSLGRKETWSPAGRSGGMVGSLWKTSEVGGPKYLENAIDATASGRFARVQRSFQRLLLAKTQSIVPSGVPRKPRGG